MLSDSALSGETEGSSIAFPASWTSLSGRLPPQQPGNLVARVGAPITGQENCTEQRYGIVVSCSAVAAIVKTIIISACISIPPGE